MALVAQAGSDVVDGGWIRDDARALATALEEVSSRCDLVVTTGGTSAGEEDHSASAVTLAGGPPKN